MIRLFIKILIILIYLSCNTKRQSTTDKNSSLKLFKKGSDLMMQAMFKDSSTSSRKHYEQAIDTFLLAYKLDTSNIELGIYLPDLYYNTQNFDSALIWALKLLSNDSSKYSKDSPIPYSRSLKQIAFCYLNIGDIEQGRKYLKKAIELYNTENSLVVQQLVELSDKIYYKKYPTQTDQLLSKKIDLCRYSLEIMILGKDICSGDKYMEEYLIPSKKIQERQKNCR